MLQLRKISQWKRAAIVARDDFAADKRSSESYFIFIITNPLLDIGIILEKRLYIEIAFVLSFISLRRRRTIYLVN